MKTPSIASLSLTAALIPLSLVGCAYQRPVEVTAQLARTETSITQAEQAGAAEASLPELQAARDKYADAQRALEKKNKESDQRALQLAQQAQLDAQYAAAKAQTSRQEATVTKVEEGVDAVRREADRDANAATTTR